jgi:hypothetical protein
MTCLEYLRLRDSYEASLRQWTRVPDAADGDAKLAAIDLWSEALSKMTSHTVFCRKCRVDKRKKQGAPWLSRYR